MTHILCPILLQTHRAISPYLLGEVKVLVHYPAIVVLPVLVGRERSVAAVREAVRLGREIGVVLQRNPDLDVPPLKDLHTVSETFIRVLLGIHHHRIEYPSPPSSSEIRKKGLPASSITLEIPTVTPPPDGLHPLERAAAEREGTVQLGPDTDSSDGASTTTDGGDD